MKAKLWGLGLLCYVKVMLLFVLRYVSRRKYMFPPTRLVFHSRVLGTKHQVLVEMWT